MIIEYLGISGVGKTTLATKDYKENKLIWSRYELYEKQGWLQRNIKKACYVLYMILFNYKWTSSFKKTIKKVKINKIKDKYVLLFNGIFLKYMLNQANNKKEKYLFDEGVFQFIWSIYLRTNNQPQPDIIEKILELFGTPNELKIVIADSKTIYNRLINRGRKTKILEEKNLLKKIDLMKERMTEIIEIANKKLSENNTIIKYIDNNKEM